MTDDVIEQVRDYLQMQVRLSGPRYDPTEYAYRGPADLLLQRGRAFEPQPLPAEWHGRELSIPRQCFDNCYRLARAARGRLRYVEGYAAAIIPVEHAWCIDEHDRVVDPTWDDGVVYFGVEVPLRAVVAARRRNSNSALFEWMAGHPFCRHDGLPLRRRKG